MLASDSEGMYADGDFDGRTGSFDGLTSDETFSTVHSNASNRVFSKMLSDFKDKSMTGGGVYH